MSYNQSILTIAVISVITYLIRSFPFIVFRNKGRDNKVINYLANVLPYGCEPASDTERFVRTWSLSRSRA